MSIRLPFEDVKPMPGMAQYQGSQVQGSYVNPTGPIDVTGPGQELARGAEALATVFQRSGEAYQKYRDVHNRTRFNEKQIEYNAHLRQGLDRIEAEIGTIPTEELRAEKLEQTLGNYVKPYQEFLGDEFDDNAEMKSRLELVYQSKYFQAQGEMLKISEKELTNRHLKHIYRHSDSVQSEINLKSLDKAKSSINLFQQTTLKSAVADGVMEPWQADAEVKKLWKEYNTVRFHADYQIFQAEDNLKGLLKRIGENYYDTEYTLSDGSKETVGLDWTRIQGLHTNMVTAVQGMATSEQKKFQTNLLKNEIEQNAEGFLNKYATRTKTGWDIKKPNAQAFKNLGFKYDIQPSQQLSLLLTALNQHQADTKKNPGAVPITEDKLEAFYTQYGQFLSDDVFHKNSGNYDPLKSYVLTSPEQEAVVAQMRNFSQLLDQHNQRLENASLEDIQEMETQILEHLNRETDVGSKKYKEQIYKNFGKLSGRKSNLTEKPATTALQDILDAENREDQAIFEGNAPLPVDELLQRQIQLGIVPKNAKFPKLPEHLEKAYGSLHNHENINEQTVKELDGRIQMQWGSSAEDIKRTYLKKLRNSTKGNESEFGAYWELYPTLEPYESATISEALRTKKEAFEGLPGVGDDIQDYISNRNTLLNVFNESNQIGAYRKLFKFLAQTEMLDSKMAPGDEWERKQIVKRAGNMLTKGWIATKTPDLGSTLVARKPMFSRIVQSNDLHEHLQHGILVGKLGLNPANIEFPEYSFPEGTTDKQKFIFKREALSGELEDGPLGGIGITAVNHPENADMWMYALILKKNSSDAPTTLSPVFYNGKPLVYDSATVKNDLIPALHRLQFLEELFTFRVPGDVIPTNTYSVQELKEILNKGLPANAPPSKTITAGQKWDIEDVGELEYEFIGDILEVAQDYAGEGNEISDKDLSKSLYFWNDKLGGFNARMTKMFRKAFGRGELPKGIKRSLPTRKRYYGELFE